MYFRQRRGRGASFPLALLAMRIFSIGLENIPPITLLFLGANLAVHLDILPTITPYFNEACLTPWNVLNLHEYHRLFWSALFHASDMHLYYNLSSWLYKGRLLEPRIGSEMFLFTTIFCLLGSSVLYVGISWILFHYAPGLAGSYHSCAVGFSAVLFGIKVILQTTEPPNRVAHVMWFQVPSKYAHWAELAIVQIIAPHASFLGHLCGILTGLLWVRVFGQSGFLPPGFYNTFFGRGNRGQVGGGVNTRPTRTGRFTPVVAPSGYRRESSHSYDPVQENEGLRRRY